MNFKSIFGGIGKGVRAVNKVTDTPVIGDLLKSIPIFGSGLAVVHSMDVLFPGDESNDLKKKVAMVALKDKHPGIDDEEISTIIEAMVAYKKTQAAAAAAQ